MGVLLSKSHKDEILNSKKGIINNQIAYHIDDECVHIAPYIQCSIPKKDRELYRVKKIPPHIRGYYHTVITKQEQILKK